MKLREKQTKIKNKILLWTWIWNYLELFWNYSGISQLIVIIALLLKLNCSIQMPNEMWSIDIEID